MLYFTHIVQSVTMQTTLSFLRQYPSGAPPLSFVSTATVNASAARQFAQSIQGSSKPPTHSTPLYIPALFPRLLELPVSGSIGTSVSIRETVTAVLSSTYFAAHHQHHHLRLTWIARDVQQQVLHAQPLECTHNIRAHTTAVMSAKSVEGSPVEYFTMSQTVPAKETLFTVLIALCVCRAPVSVCCV